MVSRTFSRTVMFLRASVLSERHDMLEVTQLMNSGIRSQELLENKGTSERGIAVLFYFVKLYFPV